MIEKKRINYLSNHHRVANTNHDPELFVITDKRTNKSWALHIMLSDIEKMYPPNKEIDVNR